MSVKVTIKGQHWVSGGRHLGKMGCAPILSVSVHKKDQKCIYKKKMMTLTVRLYEA